jgi:hypothetical protein
LKGVLVMAFLQLEEKEKFIFSLITLI